MRPIRLEIEGLRSFRAPQPIDFAGRDHIAIVGDTGAGKSSILEALTWALYGRTTFSGHANQELMNSTSTAMRVVLQFSVGGERWEVARAAKRTAKGTVGPASAVLRRLGEDDRAVEQVEGVKQVNARVTELVGLDADAFLRTVVLPQGQFARLLVDDDPSARAQVLGQIWRTDELEAAGALAEEALAELEPLAARVDQALAGEPDDPEGHLAALRATAAEREEAARTAEERLAALREQAGKHEQALARRDELARLAAGLTGWDAAAARSRCEQLAGEAAELAAAEAGDAGEEEAVRDRLAAVPADDDGLALEEVVAVETRLGVVAQLLDDVAAARDEAAAAAAAAAEADAALGEAAAERDRADDAHRAAVDARGPLAEAAEAAQREHEAAAERLARARQAAEVVARLRAEVEAAAVEVAGRAARVAAAEAAARQAAAARDAAQRADAAAAAAHGLHAGDPCPVCDRELPEGWTAPSSADLADAVAAAERAAAEAREAATARQLAEERHRQAEARLAEAEAALDPDLDLDRSDDDLLAAQREADQAAAAVLAAHEQEVGRLAEAARAAHAAAAAAEARAAAAARRRDDYDRRAAELDTRLATELGALPEGWRPAGRAAVDGLRDALAERRATLEERRRERDACLAALQELQERASRRTEARHRIELACRELAGAAAAHRQRLLDACAAAGVEPPSLPEADPAASDPAAVGTAVGALAAAAAAVAEALAAEARAAEEEAASAAAALGGVDLDAVAREVEEARYLARQAAEEAERFAGRLKAIVRVRDAAARLEETRRTLADLAAALKPGAFPKWLTLRRSRDLLVHASRLLGEMTGGRYAFADLEDTAGEWLIVDAEHGAARSPASLSGGEKFVASLALALGMVELAARSGGRLEALFLDEGFGALDRDNLDAAVTALAQAASSGRMVATISHLRAVAEQVEHVLSVTREPGGTRARWLDPAERRALAHDDVRGDAAVERLLG